MWTLVIGIKYYAGYIEKARYDNIGQQIVN